MEASTANLTIKPYLPNTHGYAPRISNQQWDLCKDDLTMLHVHGHTRAQMLDHLRFTFGFAPSAPQLNTQMTRWGLRVYAPRSNATTSRVSNVQDQGEYVLDQEYQYNIVDDLQEGMIGTTTECDSLEKNDKVLWPVIPSAHAFSPLPSLPSNMEDLIASLRHDSPTSPTRCEVNVVLSMFAADHLSLVNDCLDLNDLAYNLSVLGKRFAYSLSSSLDKLNEKFQAFNPEHMLVLLNWFVKQFRKLSDSDLACCCEKGAYKGVKVSLFAIIYTMWMEDGYDTVVFSATGTESIAIADHFLLHTGAFALLIRLIVEEVISRDFDHAFRGGELLTMLVAAVQSFYERTVEVSIKVRGLYVTIFEKSLRLPTAGACAEAPMVVPMLSAHMSSVLRFIRPIMKSELIALSRPLFTRTHDARLKDCKSSAASSRSYQSGTTASFRRMAEHIADPRWPDTDSTRHFPSKGTASLSLTSEFYMVAGYAESAPHTDLMDIDERGNENGSEGDVESENDGMSEGDADSENDGMSEGSESSASYKSVESDESGWF